MTSVENTNSENKDNGITPSDRFDIKLVYDSFEKCCSDCNSLDMEQYLIAFRELYRFFTLLGSVFGFVASDILSKVGILDEYIHSEVKDHYTTIQSMIEHEVSKGKTNNPSQPSGSRTLLRLHRSLEFVMSFMQEFSMAEAGAKSSTIAQKCYKDSLSKYHPWYIRKGACVAMYTLPARQQFIERVHGGSCSEPLVEYYSKIMGDIATISRKVFDETQKLYEANDLLDLP